MSYEEDKAICEAATAGPWEDDEDPSLVVTSDKQGTICDAYSQCDQRYIKYFHPAAMLQRIEREEAKDRRIEELEIYHANDDASICIEGVGFVHGTAKTIEALEGILE